MTKAPVRFESGEFHAIDHPANNFTSAERELIADHVNARLDEWFGKNAVRVSGYRDDGVWRFDEVICGEKKTQDTHVAYLVGIEPISRGVTKQEIIDYLHKGQLCADYALDLADRIERDGIKP